MTEVPTRGGGWGVSYRHMSDGMIGRVERDDQIFARESAKAEREARARAAAFRDSAMRASIEAALDRGELINIRQAWAQGGVGRTHAEVLAEASARMDLEDRREAYRRRKEGAEVSDSAWADEHSADTSAPDTTSEAAIERAAHQAQRAEERQFVRRAWGVAESVITAERAKARQARR